MDGHVHIHDRFDLGVALDSAAANFARGARRLRLGDRTPGCLMLTENAGAEKFTELRRRATERTDAGPWGFHLMPEPCSLTASRDRTPPLLIVAGRQIMAREDLEVIVVGCTKHFGEGRAIDEVIEQALDISGLVVLPWVS